MENNPAWPSNIDNFFISNSFIFELCEKRREGRYRFWVKIGCSRRGDWIGRKEDFSRIYQKSILFLSLLSWYVYLSFPEKRAVILSTLFYPRSTNRESERWLGFGFGGSLWYRKIALAFLSPGGWPLKRNRIFIMGQTSDDVEFRKKKHSRETTLWKFPRMSTVPDQHVIKKTLLQFSQLQVTFDYLLVRQR